MTGKERIAVTDRGAGGGQPQEDDEATKARREAWQAYYAQLAQLRKDRLTAATSAMTSDSGMGGSGGQNAATGAGLQNPASFAGAAPGGWLPLSFCYTAMCA